MSKKRKPMDADQMSLLQFLRPEEPPRPGAMNISMRMRQSVSNAIRKSGMDRIEICAAIYKLTGVEVSKHSLDKWSAESCDLTSEGLDVNGNKRWGMPAEVVPAFCHVTSDFDLLFILAEACNYKALKGKDVVRAKLGLLKERIAKDTQELKSLEKALVEAAE